MFSVIIPYYKKRNYIERCLDSVFAQTYTNYEVILIDDGSNDGIENLIYEKYFGKLNLIQQSNQGVSAARNQGINLANYNYVAFLDADDYWSPFYLDYASQVISNELEIKILGSNFSRVKKELPSHKPTLNYRIIENYFSKEVFRNPLFFTSATIVNKEFFLENDGFNTKMKRGEDLDVWFRAIASGGKVVFINNTLVYYSDEDENQMSIKTIELKFSILSVMLKQYNNESSPLVLRDFSRIFIRKRIYPYFFSSVNHEDAKKILKQIGYGNLFSKLLYFAPPSIVKNIIGKKVVGYYIKYLVK